MAIGKPCKNFINSFSSFGECFGENWPIIRQTLVLGLLLVVARLSPFHRCRPSSSLLPLLLLWWRCSCCCCCCCCPSPPFASLVFEFLRFSSHTTRRRHKTHLHPRHCTSHEQDRQTDKHKSRHCCKKLVLSLSPFSLSLCFFFPLLSLHISSNSSLLWGVCVYVAREEGGEGRSLEAHLLLFLKEVGCGQVLCVTALCVCVGVCVSLSLFLSVRVPL